jgi:hypothetical protein
MSQRFGLGERGFVSSEAPHSQLAEKRATRLIGIEMGYSGYTYQRQGKNPVKCTTDTCSKIMLS